MWEQVSQALNQSVTRVATRVATLLPGFIALGVGLADRSAHSLGDRVHIAAFACAVLTSMAKWRLGICRVCVPNQGRSPTDIVVRVVSWVVIIMGLLVGINAFEATLTSQLVAQLFAYIPNVLAAGLVLIIGAIAARFFSRSVLIGAVNLNVQYAHLLSVGLKWLILVLAGAMALNHLEIGGKIVDEAFAILFGGIVLTLALAVGLGARDL